MYATQGRYSVRVSKLKHYYDLSHRHDLTTRTYRRARRFDFERFRKQWVATFGERAPRLGAELQSLVHNWNHTGRSMLGRGESTR
jgi:hypothetical protein